MGSLAWDGHKLGGPRFNPPYYRSMTFLGWLMGIAWVVYDIFKKVLINKIRCHGISIEQQLYICTDTHMK